MAHNEAAYGARVTPISGAPAIYRGQRAVSGAGPGAGPFNELLSSGGHLWPETAPLLAPCINGNGRYRACEMARCELMPEGCVEPE